MRADVTKLQVLTGRGEHNPIFYCHASDRDHDPHFDVVADGDAVVLSGRMLFKVKANPQTLRRIDVYMTVEQARTLGAALEGAAGPGPVFPPNVSNANPNASRRGSMELPIIVWARYLRTLAVEARIGPGLTLSGRDGVLYVDFETPHESFIRMGSQEVHLGIALDAAVGSHDPAAAELVEVDERELQRSPGRAPEGNPVPKIGGGVSMWLGRDQAAGLGRLLSTFDAAAR